MAALDNEALTREDELRIARRVSRDSLEGK